MWRSYAYGTQPVLETALTLRLVQCGTSCVVMFVGSEMHEMRHSDVVRAYGKISKSVMKMASETGHTAMALEPLAMKAHYKSMLFQAWHLTA